MTGNCSRVLVSPATRMDGADVTAIRRNKPEVPLQYGPTVVHCMQKLSPDSVRRTPWSSLLTQQFLEWSPACQDVHFFLLHFFCPEITVRTDFASLQTTERLQQLDSIVH